MEQAYADRSLDTEDIDHEVVARYVEEHLLTDEAAIRDAVQRNRSFGRWMRDQLDKVLAELFNALLYEGMVDMVPDDYSRTMREIVTGGRIHAPVSVKADFGDDWSKYNRSGWETHSTCIAGCFLV